MIAASRRSSKRLPVADLQQRTELLETKHRHGLLGHDRRAHVRHRALADEALLDCPPPERLQRAVVDADGCRCPPLVTHGAEPSLDVLPPDADSAAACPALRGSRRSSAGRACRRLAVFLDLPAACRIGGNRRSTREGLAAHRPSERLRVATTTPSATPSPASEIGLTLWSCGAIVANSRKSNDRRYGGHFVLRIGDLVGDTGLEPVTSCMSSKCSNQLS